MDDSSNGSAYDLGGSLSASSGASGVRANATGDVPLVKSGTFETIHRYVQAEFGEDAFQELLTHLSPELAERLVQADLNGWYPEAELHEVIHAIHEHLAGGDDERFLTIARGLALAGISRFFRVVIGFASARFVLRKVPVLWTRLRRGPASLVSEVAEDGRVLVHYSDYEYCYDPVYRLLSIANCQALVVAATKEIPAAMVMRYDDTSMTLAFGPFTTAP